MKPAAIRLIIAVLALWGVGVGASALTAADAETESTIAALSPREIADLLVDDGGVVVDAEGRPVRGRDGKPLRVDRKGRVIDSRGRVVRDKRGRPLRVAPGRRVPADAAKPDRKRRAKRRKRPERPADTPGARPVKKPGASPTIVSSDPIVIGAAYQDHVSHNVLLTSVGAKQRAGDPLPQLQATIDHINASGGVGGRRVELRDYEYDFNATPRPGDHTLNEACAFFKERPRPVAVVHSGVRPWVLGPCLAEAGIPLVTHFPGTMPRAWVQQHGSGSPIAPGSLGLDRFAQIYVSSLRRLGFITPNTRVGLAWYGAPGYDESAERVQRELANAHIPLVAQHRSDATSGVGAQIASAHDAVSAFQRQGVARVLTIDNFGTIVGLIGLNCQHQNCNWRYGISSLNSPNFIAVNAKGDDLEGAVGVGWAPLLDLAEDAGEAPGTRGTCAEIMRSRGVDVGDRSPYGEYSAMGYCDDLLAIRAALTGREATGAGVRAGMEALGTAFGSGLTLGTRLGPGRHDGADSFRLMRYHHACTCFRYTGEPFGD